MHVLMATADHAMIDRRILQEAESLITKGHQVRILAGFECAKRESYVQNGIAIERFVFDWGDSRFAPVARKARAKIGSGRYGLVWRAFKFWSEQLAELNSFQQFILDRMMEYPVDVLHVHDFPMLASGVALARKRNVPLIYDAHEIYYSQVQLPEIVQKKYRTQEARLIKSPDAVITVNPFLARIMKDRYAIAEPDVIMNAAPIRPIADAHPLRDRFNLGPDARILLYQGWISSNRGIERIVEAAKSFDPGIHLVVIGYGDFEKDLKELADKLQLGNVVHFYGGVASDELHPLTCDADLGVIPYHGVDENNYYCSPNKLFEFAIAGLPFLANDLPFLREISTNYGCGRLVDLNSPAAIADAVNKAFGDVEGLRSLKAGALRAREELNWAVEERKLFGTYEKALAAHARKQAKSTTARA